MADAETRAQGGENARWDQKMVFDEEKVARQEFDWLVSHSNMREYWLVAVTPMDAPYHDDLDDDVPF